MHPLVLGHVRLEAVLEAEHLPGPLPVPDQRVERREQRHPVPLAPSGRVLGQRRRISPGRRSGLAPARDLRSGDRDGGQARRQRGVGDQPGVLTRLAGEEVQPVVLDQVRVADHAKRPGADARQVGDALGVGRVRRQQLGGQHPLGHVVDPPPARPPGADHVTGVEQPFHCDLDV